MLEIGQPSTKLRKEGRGNNIISFFNKDLVEIHNANNNPMVISMAIAKYTVRRILVDSKNLDDVIFYYAFV